MKHSLPSVYTSEEPIVFLMDESSSEVIRVTKKLFIR